MLRWPTRIKAKIAQHNAQVKAVIAQSKQQKLSPPTRNNKEDFGMLLWRKFIVRKNERGLLFKEGDFQKFLEAGTYYYFDPLHKVTVTIYDLSVPEFEHPLKDFLIKQYPIEITRYFTVVELGPQQLALVYKNGCLTDLLLPNTRTLYWKGIIEVTVEIVDISQHFSLPKDKAALLEHAQATNLQQQVKQAICSKEIPEHHLGLLYVEGQCLEILKPGLHAYWQFNRNIVIETVNTRLQEMEVSGQEILTKDKVSLRINLAATYLIKDVLQMKATLTEPIGYLYRELQFGLRAAVGTRTLDELLENKTVIDEWVLAHIRAKTEHFGLEVRSIGVKDIILPGAMQTILSKVVEAEKLAQANLIRRREETAATRSLLNTAKVMEDNPTALRLKELEMLEKVTEKIGNISVYGGLEGLLKELIKIKP
jgi:regulator of protease activity HflC (stomatin/prohibitin superfamily)